MQYELLNCDALPYRRAYVGSFPTVEAAIAAIPGTVAFWDTDPTDGGINAITATGSLYAVERSQ